MPASPCPRLLDRSPGATQRRDPAACASDTACSVRACVGRVRDYKMTDQSVSFGGGDGMAAPATRGTTAGRGSAAGHAPGRQRARAQAAQRAARRHPRRRARGIRRARLCGDAARRRRPPRRRRQGHDLSLLPRQGEPVPGTRARDAQPAGGRDRSGAAARSAGPRGRRDASSTCSCARSSARAART